MDNFLTMLYYERFTISEREKKLMNAQDFDSDGSRVRNDQSISEVREQTKVIDRIIEQYLNKIKGD